MFKAYLFACCILIFQSFRVYSEDDFPVPPSWAMPALIEHAREKSPNNIEGQPFNKIGLVDTYPPLSHRDLYDMEAIQLQKYADIVTHAYTDAVAEQLPDSLESIDIQTLNQTSIANISYISINASKQKIRLSAKSILNAIQQKLRQKTHSFGKLPS